MTGHQAGSRNQNECPSASFGTFTLGEYVFFLSFLRLLGNAAGLAKTLCRFVIGANHQ